MCVCVIVCACTVCVCVWRNVCRYEREGRVRATVKAQRLWFAILDSQSETGTPYMLYKDACNRKSNQQVIIQYT